MDNFFAAILGTLLVVMLICSLTEHVQQGYSAGDIAKLLNDCQEAKKSPCKLIAE